MGKTHNERVLVTLLSAGLCLLLSRISSAFCLWVLQGGAGAEAPSGVQTSSGVQAAVLLAASDKSHEFSSAPAFLVSLLLSPTSETLSACAICSTSPLSALGREMQTFHCSLCCCTVISVHCAALAHVATKRFPVTGLWFAVDFANLFEKNLSIGKLLWSRCHWVIKQSKMLQVRLSPLPLTASVTALGGICNCATSWAAEKTGQAQVCPKCHLQIVLRLS